MFAHSDHGFATRSIHAGYEPDSLYGSINTPIYASTTFAQNGLNELRGGFEYTRCGNPTIVALEATVASLEGAEYGRAFSSGMAATDVLLRTLLGPGDHLIFGHDAYGGTFRLIDQVFAAWGVSYTVVDTTKAAEVGAALRPNTSMVWLETPSNPGLAITDIAAVKDQLNGYAARLVVDNTFASPYLQSPLVLGGGRSSAFHHQVSRRALRRSRRGSSNQQRRNRRGRSLPPRRSRCHPLSFRRLPHHPRNQNAGSTHGPPLRQRRSPSTLFRRPPRSSRGTLPRTSQPPRPRGRRSPNAQVRSHDLLAIPQRTGSTSLLPQHQTHLPSRIPRRRGIPRGTPRHHDSSISHRIHPRSPPRPRTPLRRNRGHRRPHRRCPTRIKLRR